jgi:hypothetical protein
MICVDRQDLDLPGGKRTCHRRAKKTLSGRFSWLGQQREGSKGEAAIGVVFLLHIFSARKGVYTSLASGERNIYMLEACQDRGMMRDEQKYHL